MKSKGQFNFAWMFALIIGGSILVLAIYGAVNFGDTQRTITDSKNAKNLGVLIDPLSAGFSESSFGVIEFNDVTRLENFCSTIDFGYNEISTATRSDVLSEWNLQGVPTRLSNKYIFSDEFMESESFYVLSMPFEFPYKVTDVLFVTTEDYCFINAPEEVVTLVRGSTNIKTTECLEDSTLTQVCFGSGSKCPINVVGSCRSSHCDSVYDEGTVSKAGYQVKYVGNLMYGAIFSSEDNYECNVDRLLHRTGEFAKVLSRKADLMNLRGCNTNLKRDIIEFGSRVGNSSYEDILSIEYSELDRRNSGEVCGLWD